MDQFKELSEFMKKKPHVHIIGGGGVGMSALAVLIKKKGFHVSASDINESPYLTKLRSYHISTWIGHHPEKIPENSVVFYSTAIKENDPERIWARENAKEFPRHPLLTYLTKDFYTIGITGTHGKTTTTAWISYLMEKAQLDPTSLVGGTLKNWGSSLRLGKGKINEKPLLIIEADESDHSFLNIDCNIGIITNIEMDHPDHYDKIEDVYGNFGKFIKNTCNNGGRIIFSIESKHFINEFSIKSDCPFLEEIIIDEKKATLILENQKYPVGLKGIHNLYNASSVLMTGRLLGIDTDIIQKSIAEFKGVSRRMEIILKKEINERTITIMDDYGHHPTEIRSVLNALSAQTNPVIALWEPHRITRFMYFYNEFNNLIHDFKIPWILLPFFSSGDHPKDYPEFTEKLNNISKKFAMDLNQEISIKDLTDEIKKIMFDSDSLSFSPYRDYLNLSNSWTIIFFGAGNSSSHAKEFSHFLQDL